MAFKVTRKLYHRSGTLLQLLEEEVELRGETDVLIEVKAVALNYRDVNILQGTKPWPVKENGIPCSDAAGLVLAIGSSVSRFSIGDHVSPIFDQKSITGQEQEREWLGGEIDGVIASHVVFDEEKLIKVPEHLSWIEAACLPCAGLTAWNALHFGGGVGEKKVVLIQGTGGVSLMALKFARAKRCRVIVTSSSDEKLERGKNLDGIREVHTINYKMTLDWDVEAKKLNGGVGVDVVIENGGTSSLLKSVNAVAKRGVISQVGYLGVKSPGDMEGLLKGLIDKFVTLRGINVGSRLEMEEMNRVIGEHKMHFEDIVDKVFGFEKAESAFGYLWEGRHVGKVVIEL